MKQSIIAMYVVACCTSATFELTADFRRDLISNEVQRIEQLVQQISSKTVDLGQLTAKLDAIERSMTAQLNASRQDEQSARALEQRALSAKLESHHDAVQGSQRSIDKSLTAIQQTQSKVVSSQRQLQAGIARTRIQTARTSRDMGAHFRATDQQHRKTRKLIVTMFRDVQITSVKQVSIPPSSGREIVFQGKKQDIIVPTLYMIKMDLASVFDKLYTQYSHNVSRQDISWLESELQNLLASAAQEEARLHPRSTATPFDAWVYPGIRRGGTIAKGTERSAFTEPVQETVDPKDKKGKQTRSQLSLRFRTARWSIEIRLPQRGVLQISDASEEVGVVLQPTAPEVPILDARFVRLKERYLAPKICGQLNIFLPIDIDETYGSYFPILKNGSIPEIDQALRIGTICPYHNVKIEGFNTNINPLYIVSPIREPLSSDVLMQQTSAQVGRVDILRYLDSQGLGISTLR